MRSPTPQLTSMFMRVTQSPKYGQFPSLLTVDKSQSGRLKFYTAGGPLNPADADLAKRDCKIYRFTVTSDEVNINEVPEKQLCTLSGLPQGYLISPTADYDQWYMVICELHQ
jgi:hypothetical protein